MFPEKFEEKLVGILSKGLPGIEAQMKMAPSIRKKIKFDEADYPDAKKASTLLLLFYEHDKINIIFIKRPEYDGVHGGQISFPGGKIEAEDEDAMATALRETEEEIGIKKSDIKIIGHLSNLYIPPSNFFVYPFVGILNGQPQFVIDKNEVENIFYADIKDVLNEEKKQSESMTRQGFTFQVPFYRIEGFKIWGATAMMLSEFETLLRKIF